MAEKCSVGKLSVSANGKTLDNQGNDVPILKKTCWCLPMGLRWESEDS